MQIGKVVERKYRDWRNELELTVKIKLDAADEKIIKNWYSTNICGVMPKEVMLRVIAVYDTSVPAQAVVDYEMNAVHNLEGEMGWIQYPESMIPDNVKNDVALMDWNSELEKVKEGRFGS